LSLIAVESRLVKEKGTRTRPVVRALRASPSCDNSEMVNVEFRVRHERREVRCRNHL